MRHHLILAAALLVIATPALADGARDARLAPIELRVDHSDLNLATNAGQSKLEARLLRTMEAICGERPNPKLIERTENFLLCKASLTLSPADTTAPVRAAFTAARSRLR